MNPAGEEPADQSDELERLRRTIRDLVAFSTLFSDCAIHGPAHIASSLAQTVRQSLASHLVYVRFPRPSGEVIESLRCADEDNSPAKLERVKQAVEACLVEPIQPRMVVRDPLGEGWMQVGVTRIGMNKESGVMIAASHCESFPSEEEYLLLRVASNQAAVAFQKHHATEMQGRLAAIIESAEDAIVSKTLEGRITSWNPGAQRLFGYSQSETIGKSIYILIPEDCREEEKDILARLSHGEKIDHYETVRVCKDGRRVEVSLTVSPIRDESGRVIGASKIARDISGRKRAEREQAAMLQREQEALRESRLLTELALSLGAELDVDWLAQKTVDAAVELIGAGFGVFFYTSLGAAGESHLFHALAGTPERAIDSLASFGGVSAMVHSLGESPILTSDLHSDPRFDANNLPPGCGPATRSLLALPVLSRTGAALGRLFFGHRAYGAFGTWAERLASALAAQVAIYLDNAHDLAERRMAEERERSARTVAEQATRMRDAFLATASHELRTPLNSVLGWTQLMRQAPADKEIRERALDAIERGTRAQARLIEDMLDTSSIVSGKLRLQLQKVDLIQIVQTAIETIRPAAAEKDICIEKDLDTLLGPFRGDPARLHQILWNLLSNAVKFTPKAGSVRVHLKRSGSMVEIRVSDTGQGISSEFLPHVFERFWQADSSTTRAHGGLGLGLAVVRHLVELHGGTVQASSSGEGEGSTFVVRLPLAAHREIPLESPAASAPGEAGSEVELTNITILLVDDDRNFCEMLQRILRERGARVETVSSSLAALQRLEEVQPDILVSDIGMPDMDGYELIREVRKRGHTLPAIALTAFARAEDRIRSLRSGYQTQVAKPLEPRELTEVIASLLRTLPGYRS